LPTPRQGSTIFSIDHPSDPCFRESGGGRSIFLRSDPPKWEEGGIRALRGARYKPLLLGIAASSAASASLLLLPDSCCIPFILAMMMPLFPATSAEAQTFLPSRGIAWNKNGKRRVYFLPASSPLLLQANLPVSGAITRKTDETANVSEAVFFFCPSCHGYNAQRKAPSRLLSCHRTTAPDTGRATTP
jgi:hypothetical protein